MSIVANIALGLCLLALLFCCWGIVSTNRAFRQRGDITEEIFKRENYQYYLQLYNRVDYDEHMWALAFFRKPPYPEELWGMYNEPRVR